MNLLSIIIPAFNAENTICRAIDSILVQQCEFVEIIVVDDGSTDSTAVLCRQYNKKIRLIQTANKGVSAARNCGIRASSGKYIAFLDSDDEQLDCFIDVFRKAAEDRPKCKAFCGAYIFQRANEVHRYISDVFLSKDLYTCVDLIYELSCANYIVHTNTAIIHRDVFKEVGYFEEDLLFGEDLELWTRIAGKFTWCFINQDIAIYHEVASSATRVTPLWDHGIDFIYNEEQMRQVISSDLWVSYREFRRNLCSGRAWYCFKSQKYDVARLMVEKIFPAKISLRYLRVLICSRTPSFLLDIFLSKKN